MLKAESRPPRESQGVQSSTRGLAFLRTPFRESKQAPSADIVRRFVSLFKKTNALLEELKPGQSFS